MEDICLAYFTSGCSDTCCQLAHDLRHLTNLKNWVFFDAPDIDMLDFLAYKYQGHYYFKYLVLPGKGPVARLATPDVAAQVVQEYSDCYNAKLLRDVVQVLNPTMVKIPSISSDDRNSVGYGFSWADEMEAHLSELSDDISAEEHTSEGTSPQEGSDVRVPKLVSRKVRPTTTKGRTEEAAVPRDTWAPPPRRGGYHRTSCNTDSGETCTDAVLRVLKTYEGTPMQSNAGWQALKEIWSLGPEDLDHAVLTCLDTKPPKQQQHILLSFAAIDLSYVNNLSAYLNCLIKEHDCTNQVCLYFLAGLCSDEDCCWVHPVGTHGWNLLWERWQITYKDLDYTVLNFLSKKTIPEQDSILSSLADMDLTIIHNLPAYLSSMIQKYDGFTGAGRGMRRPFRKERDVRTRNDRRPGARQSNYADAPSRSSRQRPGAHEMWYPNASTTRATY